MSSCDTQIYVLWNCRSRAPFWICFSFFGCFFVSTNRGCDCVSAYVCGAPCLCGGTRNGKKRISLAYCPVLRWFFTYFTWPTARPLFTTINFVWFFLCIRCHASLFIAIAFIIYLSSGNFSTIDRKWKTEMLSLMETLGDESSILISQRKLDWCCVKHFVRNKLI